MVVKKKRKSFFYTYLRSFMLVLIVPFLTILLVYFQSQAIVKEMILTSSRDTLNQYFKRVDEVFGDAADICLNAGICQESKDYSAYVSIDPDRTAYRAGILQQKLAEYCGEMYSDIFVCFPNYGKIVSGEKASMKTEDYCRVFYGEAFWSDFDEVISRSPGKTAVNRLSDGSNANYLCISKRQRASLGMKYNHVAVVVFRQNYFSDLMSDLGGETNDGCFMLLDENLELLISSQSFENAPELSPDGGDIYETEIDGQPYIVQMRKSAVLGAYYAYAVPYSHFWEKLENLRVICGIGGVISILLGVALAWMQTHRNYRPIGKMIGNLQDKKDVSYDAGEASEFEFIERIFEAEEQEKLAMDMALRRGNEAVRSRYIGFLLEGRAECRDAGLEELRQQGISLRSTLFQVGIVRIERSGGLKPELVSFVIENVLGELCSEKHSVYLVPKQNDRIAILLNIEPEEREIGFVELLQRGKDFLEERCGITFTCGISSVKHEIGEIPTAYAEAGLALKYRYLLGEEIIIEHEEIADREFKYLPPLENKLYNKIRCFLSDDQQTMSPGGLVQQSLSDYEIDSESSLETVECFKIETLSALNRVVMAGRYWDESWEEAVKELVGVGTQDEFIGKLIELLTELRRKQREKDETEDVCRRAYVYIRKNYQDTQLSLKFLSEELGMSSSYLSRLFKERYGESISDQITRIRCEQAKADLKNTELSIREVAENNGFISADAFIKVFKKVEGVTPGGYRKQKTEM